ncbi:hypothetical protein [Nostoc sp.]|uniref:hypothetical protein n=1 Tax=Nostoc sp. TaxID=1180 RepID=UPI002FF913B3
MDLSTRRKPENLFGLMMPADPSAYKNLRQELQAKQQPSLNDSAIAANLEMTSVR